MREMGTSLDIHLASDVMSSALERQLGELGFTKDDFIGGTTGVVHPCHYSYHPASRDQFVRSWKNAINLLSTVSEKEFYGYAEAEVTPAKFCRPLPWRPFDASVPFPFERLEYEVCPVGKHKDFDIHLTVDLQSVDPGLKHILEGDVAFHYVDIRKPSGKVVRVYTFQPLGLKRSPHLYNVLLAYLIEAGGLEGKIKLETTFAYARFPSTALVPPVVMKMPLALPNA